MLVLDSHQTRYKCFHKNYFSFWLVATCRQPQQEPEGAPNEPDDNEDEDEDDED